MISNFEFLKKDFPNLAALGELAEKYWFTDSNSCLLKLGMMGETIVNLMFQYDNIPYPKENNAANRITILYKEGYLEKEFSTILHGLRKKEMKLHMRTMLLWRRQNLFWK